MLVETADWVVNARTSTYALRLAMLVLDATDGEVASESTYVAPHTDWGAGPVAVPAGDLDGDGLDDYVYLAGAVGGRLAAVLARSGRPRWSPATVPVWGSSPVVAVGDVTGDGRGDLAVVAASTVHLLRGGTGQVAWARPATGAYWLGAELGAAGSRSGLPPASRARRSAPSPTRPWTSPQTAAPSCSWTPTPPGPTRHRAARRQRRGPLGGLRSSHARGFFTIRG